MPLNSIAELERRVRRLEMESDQNRHKFTVPDRTVNTKPPLENKYASPVFLTTPLTSTSWDGDARSTTSKTKIDLSAVFGVPAGVAAILVRMAARDSGSYANAGLYISLSPTDAAGGAAILRPAGIVNDVYTDGMFIVPCDANGDVYYQIVASGTDTLDAILQVWGYFL